MALTEKIKKWFVSLQHKPIFLIVSKEEGRAPLWMKVTGERRAVVAYTSERLAHYAMLKNKVGENFSIAPLNQGATGDQRIKCQPILLLVFNEEREVDEQFNNPESYSYEKYLKKWPSDSE